MTPDDVFANAPLLLFVAVVMGICFRLVRKAFNYIYSQF